MREQLEKAASLPDLSKTIRAALNAQSCLIDLRQSAGGLAALQEITINLFLGNEVAPSEHSREAAETALLEGAISLYVRATHSGAFKGSRGSIQIVDKLSANETEDHEKLVNVRNESVAHVYQNKDVSGRDRHRGVILLVECEEGWRPGAATSRVTFDRELMGCLTRQLPIATRIISSTVDALFRKIADLIERDGGHPDFQRAIEDSEISLTEFFGSEIKAKMAVAGLDVGSMTFMD